MTNPGINGQFTPNIANVPNLSNTPNSGKPVHLTVCGIVGVVFGAPGVLLSFIPIVNNFAAILGFIGVILAVIAMISTFRGRKSGKAVSIVAAVLSVLAIVITLAMQSATVKAIDDAMNGTGTSQSGSSSGKDSKTTTGGDSKSDDGSSKDTAASTGEQDMEGDVDSGNYHIKLVSLTKTGTDYEGKPTAVLTYELTNNKNENSNYFDYSVKAFQNGRQLETAIFSQAPEGYDAGSSMTELQPGGMTTITEGYVLEDDSPVSIEVDGTLDVSGAKVTHTFTLQ